MFVCRPTMKGHDVGTLGSCECMQLSQEACCLDFLAHFHCLNGYCRASEGSWVCHPKGAPTNNLPLPHLHQFSHHCVCPWRELCTNTLCIILMGTLRSMFSQGWRSNIFQKASSRSQESVVDAEKKGWQRKGKERWEIINLWLQTWNKVSVSHVCWILSMCIGNIKDCNLLPL